MSQWNYFAGQVYTTGSSTTTFYPLGGGGSTIAQIPTPQRDTDPISWLKARVQEIIDTVDWAA
jgi:hypothetical protein